MVPNPSFAQLLDNVYDSLMKKFPVTATLMGDTRYNNLMYADFTDSYQASLRDMYNNLLDTLHQFNANDLNENDRLSYDYTDTYLTLLCDGTNFNNNRIPTEQISGNHLIIAELATGASSQPFNTIKDYDNWLSRLDGYVNWIDSAIIYFKNGLAENYTLPKPLVRSMIPQFESIVTKDAESNHFYLPVKKLPDTFPDSARSRITKDYAAFISYQLIPAYQRMTNFLKNDYLPNARTSTTGVAALPGGDSYYHYCVRLQTTTDKSPADIRETGVKEVARIRQEMEKVKEAVGFKGTLQQFFDYLRTDPQFTPYKSPDEVLNFFRNVRERIAPHIAKMFSDIPTTPLEIRRTEAYKEQTAVPEYLLSPDGIKPGLFYVPIPDVKKYNKTGGMESVFLHEAIPGHHFQASLARENKTLPKIRRNDWLSNAYAEGWALYAESLGKELGLYEDPYQYLGALGDEMLRAIRLVLDVDLHTGKMTREDAIKYMMANQQVTEQVAIAEVERYIAMPGQALGYKIGALKITELRKKYEQQLGDKFSLAAFHNEVLKDGALPLDVLEQKLDRWAAQDAPQHHP